MEFKNAKGIYQQIAENINVKILSGELPAGTKLPSVREQAAHLGVNQNTIMRTYSELQRDEIIANKRGIGYFVTDEAAQRIRNQQKAEFFETLLPEFIKQVKVLQLSKEELAPLFDQLKANSHENK